MKKTTITAQEVQDYLNEYIPLESIQIRIDSIFNRMKSMSLLQIDKTL